MEESIQDRLSSIEHRLKHLDFNQMLILQSQNSVFYYQTVLQPKQASAFLLSFLFGLISGMSFSISLVALGVSLGQPGYLIAGLVFLCLTLAGFVYLVVEWFATKSVISVAEKMKQDQQKMGELTLAKLDELAEELGIGKERADT
ncbi:MAG: hypothetical protein ISS52_00310 [Dehalococcoidia bacterium]|nr:hypothetical protein [Dehalococcoidia bacterium]